MSKQAYTIKAMSVYQYWTDKLENTYHIMASDEMEAEDIFKSHHFVDIDNMSTEALYSFRFVN